MKIRITGLPKNKKTPSLYGFGGNLGTNGSDFTDGLTYFNVPTRHETNPNGGIPLGMAPDGQPNLVEGKEENKKGDGGEIKWNSLDYIFSDRLTPSEDLIKKWKLPENFLDYTYADLVRKSPVVKESEQRPNDPISLDTLDKFLADVAEDQELTKKLKEAAKMQEQLSQMSDDELMALGAQMSQEDELRRQLEMEQLTQQPDDYANLALNAQQENIQSAALMNDMAQLQGMVQPLMTGAEGGTLLKDGGKKETDKEILKLYNRMIDDSIERFKYPNGSPYKRSKLDILLGIDLRTINLLNDPYYYSLTNPPTLEERGKALLQTLYNKGKKVADKVSDIIQDTPTPNTTSGAGYIPPYTFGNGGYKYKDTYKPLDLNTEEGQLRLIEYFVTHPKSGPMDAWLHFMPKPSDLEEDSQALFYELELQRILEKNAEEVKPYREYNFPTDRDAINAVLKLNSFLSDKFNSLKSLYDSTPTPNTTGGAGYIPSNIYAEGGQPEVIDQMPLEMPLEQLPMMNMEPQLEVMLLPMPLEVPQLPQQVEQTPQRKPAEEMSTKELNEALDEIIEYARENKDKQLLREAKKVKRSGTREEKEAFVDDTFEEIEMEQQEQAEAESATQEQQAPQEVPLELPVMMAEGGEMPTEEPQPDTSVELPQQSQDGERLIQQLLQIGDQLGYGKDSEYTPLEVEDLLNKASQDGIDVSSLQSLSSEELATMFTLLLKQVNNLGEVVQPEAPLEPLDNQFAGGGSIPNYNKETGTIILNLNKEDNKPGIDILEEPVAEPVITVNEGDSKAEQEKQLLEKVVVLPETEVVALRPRRKLSPQQFFSLLPYNNEDIFGSSRDLVLSIDKKPSLITSRELAEKALLEETKKREYQQLERKRLYLQYLLGDNALIANYIADGGELDIAPQEDNMFLSGGQLRKARRWARHNKIEYKDEKDLEKKWNAHNDAIKKWGKTYENLSAEDLEIARRINKNVDSANLRLGITQQKTEDFLNENAKGYKVASPILKYPENLFTTTRPDNWDYSKNGEYNTGGWDFSTLYGNDGKVIMRSTDLMGNPVHSNGNETIGVTYNGYNDYAAEHGRKYRYNGEDVSKDKLRELTQASKDAFVEQVKEDIKNGNGSTPALNMLWRLGAGTTKGAKNLYFDDKGQIKSNWETLYRKHSTSGAVALNHGWFKELPKLQTIYRLNEGDGKYTEVYGDDPSLYSQFYKVDYNTNDSKDGINYYDLTPKDTNRNLVTIGDVTYELPDDFNLEAFKKGRLEVTPLGPGAKNTDLYYDLIGGPSDTNGLEDGTIKRPYPFTSILKFLPFLNFPYLEDYSSYNEMANALNGIKYIDAPDHREYLKYTPADLLYRMNQAQMMGIAANRGIAGLTNRNQGTLMANLALLNAKNREALGEIGINTEKENWERNKDVVTQHNQVDLTGDLMLLDADKANLSNNPLIVDSRHKTATQGHLVSKGNNESLAEWLANLAEMANKLALNDELWYWYGRYLDSGAAAPGADIYFGRGRNVATPPYRKSSGAKNGGSLTIRRKRRNRLS